MRKISDDEFREYLEFKKFMNEVPGEAKNKKIVAGVLAILLGFP